MLALQFKQQLSPEDIKKSIFWPKVEKNADFVWNVFIQTVPRLKFIISHNFRSYLKRTAPRNEWLVANDARIDSNDYNYNDYNYWNENYDCNYNVADDNNDDNDKLEI